MITNWDIVSGIRAQDGAILHTLLIDGTEHDARLIAKKLKDYVKNPQPASAPYVYSFELPVDLDEDTVEKIRTATREGIEQAKKVNEFVPGGALGNPLYTIDVIRDDKAFPTFITLDPSESFFGGDAEKEETLSIPPEMPVEQETDRIKSIDDIQLEEFHAVPPPPPPPVPEQTQSSSDAGGLTNTEVEEIHLETQIIPNQTLPEELMPRVSIKKETRAELAQAKKDKQNQEKKKPLLETPVEDILSAQTKADLLVDLQTSKPTAKKTDAAPKATESGNTAGAFNIFEQKIKDQTCFMDLDDVNTITDRMAQKDLSFVQHAQVHDKQTDPAAPEQAAKKTSIKQAIPPSPFFRHFEEDVPQDQDVMDPFEQLLAAENRKQAKNAQTFTKTTGGNIPTPSAVSGNVRTDNPSQQERTEDPLPSTQIRENIMPENTGKHKLNLTARIPKDQPQAPSAPRPKPPVAPQQPAPGPVPPPSPAENPVPLPPNQTIPPAAPTVWQTIEIPSDGIKTVVEEGRRTLLRRRPGATTTIDKTKTIDHSIELPLSELKKHKWPLEVPLVPTYTLENTMISINRFAHATAISVIDNPGKLYNPLVLHGASGTGKTHFLHAIGYELSKKYGQENIFITNGVRLSRGIQRYMTENNIQKLEQFMEPIKALLIDDIHLLAINEQNKSYISKLLHDFTAQQKQIVMTSKYPPESLAKLEELLDFRLDSGWISELKPASGNARSRLIRRILNNNSIDITEKDQDQFFNRKGMTLGSVVRSIRRVRVLEKTIFPDAPQSARSVNNIFELLLANNGEDQQSLINSKDFNEISAAVLGNGEWGRIGFFYPQNHSDKINWLLFALQQRAKELGIEGGPELAVRSSYSTENIISSAFKIANLCDNKKLKGAVILGPDLTACEPSVRENFYDILTHMLEIMLIHCGIINYEDLTAPSTYVKVLSELLR